MVTYIIPLLALCPYRYNMAPFQLHRLSPFNMETAQQQNYIHADTVRSLNSYTCISRHSYGFYRRC